MFISVIALKKIVVHRQICIYVYLIDGSPFNMNTQTPRWS